jgi:hypothetical protein
MVANVMKLKIADKNILFMFASLSVANLSAILCHQRTKMAAQMWTIGHSTRKIVLEPDSSHKESQTAARIRA